VLVSVVMPSFNQARYLPAALDSVLCYSGDLELVVMDGGSGDGSVEVLERYAPRLAHWQSAPDGGQAAAINAGFARARGDLLCWLNSDDMHLPGALERVVAAAGRSPRRFLRHGSAVHLRESPTGRYCAVASVHAVVASPYKAAYVAAKHGVLGLVKTLALEGAQDGIAATAVCPGYVRTPLVEGQIPEQAAVHGMGEDEVLEEVILAPHAVKRLIEPDEVAETVAFLLGPGGASFTGVPVVMDHGWSAS